MDPSPSVSISLSVFPANGGGWRAATATVDATLEVGKVSSVQAFLTREAKFARRWLYGKGIMLPEEDLNPVDAELRAFFECCKDPLHKRPKADLTAGLNDSTAVILSPPLSPALSAGPELLLDT